MVQFVKNSLIGCLLLVVAGLICPHVLFAGINGGRVPALAAGDTIRILLVGNSFSNNATTYLREIAQSDGKVVILGRAERPGWSLQLHWHDVEKSEADRAYKPYDGKSLKELLVGQPWDVVTLQQNSMNSSDPATYRPYVGNLYRYIREHQPHAEVIIHQTWAYRSDAEQFGSIGNGEHATAEKEMWQRSRKAYQTIASELGVRRFPVGDAFWLAGRSRAYGYQRDKAFNYDNPVFPALPDQRYALHVGYHWSNSNRFSFDPNHANENGCYLGSLVWYGVLTGKNLRDIIYKPESIAEDYAVYLRKVAAKAIKKSAR